LPPHDDFSISINLLPPAILGCEQYLFDFDRSVVTRTFMADALGPEAAAGAAQDGRAAADGMIKLTIYPGLFGNRLR
jgi:hypothetical protein